MDFNDLDDDESLLNDDFKDSNEESIQEDQTDDIFEEDTNNTEDEQTEDILEEYLKSRGISNLNSIKFEDENGEIVEKDWYSLSKEEQLNILGENYDNSEDTDLDSSEIDFINRLRLLKATPEQYIESIKQQAVAEYANSLKQEEVPIYSIDDLSDEALYLYDLENRVGEGELSDEQLQNILEQAKSNPEIFEKQMKGIRSEYKRMEDEQRKQSELLEQQKAEQEYINFSNIIQNEIQQLKEIGELDIDMSADEMNTLNSFVLERDASGMSFFGKALNEPKTLVKLAWYALYGEKMIKDLSDYYKKEINSVSKTNYQKGLLAGQSGEKPTVVINKNKKQSNSSKSSTKIYKSIDDLD